MLTLTSAHETAAHRWPAGPKLAAAALGSALIFPVQALPVIGGALLALAALHLVLGWGFTREAAGRLWMLWPFLLVLTLWHLWTGEIRAGAVIAGRMIFAVALANLVTMTTRLDAMLAAVERVLTPFARFGLNPRVLALAVALVIRFTPVLLDKAGQLRQAWRARSPKRAGVAIVLPLVLTALDDADHVAEALRARGGL